MKTKNKLITVCIVLLLLSNLITILTYESKNYLEYEGTKQGSKIINVDFNSSRMYDVNFYYIEMFDNNFIMYDSQTYSEVYKDSYSSEIGKAMLKDNQ